MIKRNFALSGIALLLMLILLSACSQGLSKAKLTAGTWVPYQAQDADGKAVELGEIYQSYSDQYQGSLTFREDGTFSLWLTPGEGDDGTHSGTYELQDGQISACFDEGTQTAFTVGEKDGVYFISLGYGDYTVYFHQQQS